LISVNAASNTRSTDARSSVGRKVFGLRDRLMRRLGRRDELLGPEQLIWVFGFPRSGTTWLARMLAGLDPRHTMWKEPYVGQLFGEFYFDKEAERRPATYVMSPEHREAWLPSIRTMVLRGAAARFPGLPQHAYVVIKEPNGWLGAPLLSAALPESGLVFLARDPRDVIASGLDANRLDGWTADLPVWRGREKPPSLADTDPDAFVREMATRYRRAFDQVNGAFEAHRGPKARVRYEDLRAHPVEVLGQVCRTLAIPASDGDVVTTVDRWAWEQIPSEMRGEGKFFRKATPGAWRGDLTPQQVEIIEGETAPILSEFFS